MAGLFVWALLRETPIEVPPISDEVSSWETKARELTDQNAQLKKDLAAAKTDSAKTSDTESVPIKNLPVVTYERAGLGNDALFAEFDQKLVGPLRDWALDNGHTLLTLNIEIPENDGEEFIYTAIYDDGGSEGSIFGSKGEPLDWWVPSCLDQCTFSAEFKTKYPQVIQQYNTGQ